jgi:hypothetical protein
MVKERKRRLSLNPKKRKSKRKNPLDPVSAFAGITGGVASALHIKEMLNRSKRKTRRRANPKTKAVAKKRANPKTKKRANPKTKVPHRRTFKMFQGRAATTAKMLQVSRFAPARMDQLGDLIELKLIGAPAIKMNPRRYKLCAAGGKLWIAGGKFAKANPAEKPNVINPVGQVDHVVYGTRKPHHGDVKYTHYIHRLGEDNGRLPMLCVDREGFPIIRGGDYKIESRGIVN